MALVALEQAVALGSKVAGPLIMDAILGTGIMGSALAGRFNNTTSIPSAPPSNAPPPQQPSDANLRVRLDQANITPEVLVTIANQPVVPPSAANNPNNSRVTRQDYLEGKGRELRPSDIQSILSTERAVIAQFFNTSAERVAAIPELDEFAMNAVTGAGPVFSRDIGQQVARELMQLTGAEDRLLSMVRSAPRSPVALAITRARSDYEMKIGGPVTLEQFVETLAARGTSGPRIEAAWQRISGPLGGNPATTAVFRRWVLDRILPGAAGSAVTYALERIASSVVPSEHNNRNVTVEDIRQELLDHELRTAADELDIGDEARSVVGSASWYDKLSALPGSVQWTPNTSTDTGLSVDPYPAPIVPPIMGDIITYPGDGVFSRKLRGDTLSERPDDTRAMKRVTGLKVADLELPKRTGLPPVLVIPDAPKFNGLGMHATHGQPTPYFPAIHQTARQTDHIGSQTYDTTMVANVPSFVSPATSSAGGLYGRDSRAYRNPLDSAPNVTGIGFDAQETERRLVEAIGVSDGSTNPPTTSPQTNPFADDQRSYQSRQEPAFVPVGDMTNPLFANVGAQQPVKPSTQQPLPFPLQ